MTEETDRAITELNSAARSSQALLEKAEIELDKLRSRDFFFLAALFFGSLALILTSNKVDQVFDAISLAELDRKTTVSDSLLGVWILFLPILWLQSRRNMSQKISTYRDRVAVQVGYVDDAESALIGELNFSQTKKLDSAVFHLRLHEVYDFKSRAASFLKRSQTTFGILRRFLPN